MISVLKVLQLSMQDARELSDVLGARDFDQLNFQIQRLERHHDDLGAVDRIRTQVPQPVIEAEPMPGQARQYLACVAGDDRQYSLLIHGNSPVVQ